MSEFDFGQSTVLVTGASRGLGLALVGELNQLGTKKIYAACRNQEGCDFVNDLHLDNVTAVALDMTDQAQIADVAGSIQELDLLINNAGIASACPYLKENAIEVARAEMEVHYFGPLHLTNLLANVLSKSEQGGVINISSIAGITNFKNMGTYSASKTAQHFLTQGLRAEFGKNLHVMGVYPGPFDTRLAGEFENKPSPESIAKIIMHNFIQKVEDLFPDAFSQEMHNKFLESPKLLESIFSSF